MRVAIAVVLGVAVLPSLSRAAPLFGDKGSAFPRGTRAFEANAAYIHPIRFSDDHFYGGNVAGHYFFGDEVSVGLELQGYFVVCSGQGIASGACVPSWTSVGFPEELPLVKSVDGRPLTSAEAIESAAAAGQVVPINLGPGAVIVGTLSGH